MELNVKLLKQVARHIKQEPRRLQMEEMRTPVRDIPKLLRPPCGTACCIAGWAIVLSGKAKRFRGNFPVGNNKEALGADTAAGILGLPSSWLFFTGQWPEKLRDRFDAAKTPKAKASAAVAAISHAIKNKGWR